MVIDFLKGKMVYTGNDCVVIEVGGIGYQVYVTNSSSIQRNADIFFYTHFVVREDAHLLYGFSTLDERDLFRLLIEVSGVGPKAAMGILANSEIASFVQAVHREDIPSLTCLPGIGKKTAQRLILDLKDKLKTWSIGESVPDSENNEVLEALMALGYKDSEAREAMNQVVKKQGRLSTEDWIKQALRSLVRV